MQDFRKPWFAAAAIAIVVLLAYLPTFTGAFFLDDHVLIEKNPFLAQIRPAYVYFMQEDGVTDPSQWQDAYHTGYYRPLVSLSYAIDHRLWGGSPAGFRATNLFLHLAVCFTLFAFLRRRVADDLTSLAAVLVFALHPANTEAVAWISSRNNLMASLFSLMALHFYAGERRGAGPGSLICFALALFSKEYGVMVLPILFAWNRTLGAGRRSWQRELAGYLPFMAVLVGYFWLRASVTGAVLSPAEGPLLWTRLAMVPYLILFHLRLVFIPAGLHSFSVQYPAAGQSGVLVLGAAGLALVLALVWRYRREKALVMGVAGFLCGLFPVLHIVPTSAVSLVSMRWLYFPMVFFSLAWCRPIGALLRKPALACLLAGAVTALGGYSAYLNRYQWHDDGVFFEREVIGFGNLVYAGGLADIRHSQGAYREAEIYYRLAIAARPDVVETHIGYAALLIDTGRPAAALEVLDAVAGWTMRKENRGRMKNNRAIALLRLGKPAAAIADLEAAVALAPAEAAFWGNLGSAYGMAGDFAQSARALEKGLTLAPESVGLLSNLALTRLHLRDLPGAAAAFARLPAHERQKRADIAARIGGDR